MSANIPPHEGNPETTFDQPVFFYSGPIQRPADRPGPLSPEEEAAELAAVEAAPGLQMFDGDAIPVAPLRPEAPVPPRPAHRPRPTPEEIEAEWQEVLAAERASKAAHAPFPNGAPGITPRTTETQRPIG